MNYTKLLPIVGEGFNEAPLYFSLSEDSEYHSLFAGASQASLQVSLDKLIASKGKAWSISGYLENRATILAKYPQMISQGRTFHLGIDINIPVGSSPNPFLFL